MLGLAADPDYKEAIKYFQMVFELRFLKTLAKASWYIGVSCFIAK